MPASSFEYAIIRVVPRVERGEFLNVGAVLYCTDYDFLEARIELCPQRLNSFAPTSDIALIEAHLKTIPLICKGGTEAGMIGAMTQRARFHWLVAPRSTIIQPSPPHSGLCENPRAALDDLIAKMVSPRT